MRLGPVAFVDDDPMERADVERTLPEVTVLAPEEVADALSWPEFDPGPVTDGRPGPGWTATGSGSARRAARAAFDGSEEDFLRWCELRATLRPGRGRRRRPAGRAGPADHPVQLDRRRVPPGGRGGGARAGRPVRRRRAGRGGRGVRHRTVRSGRSSLVAVSCRAGGRGAVPVLLTGLARLARSRGAGRLLVPCRLTERNVPVRLGPQAGRLRRGRAAPATPRSSPSTWPARRPTRTGSPWTERLVEP